MHMLVMPWLRAWSQLDDPAFLGVLGRGLLGSALCFAALAVGLEYGAWRVLPADWHWVAALFGVFGAGLLALFLFLPVAVVIATLLMDRIAAAVDRRFRPYLPAPNGAMLAAQIWDGLALGVLVLAANMLALVLAAVLPGIGLLLGWAVAAWAVGRGLFVAVAMRRMTRAAAQDRYARHRTAILLQGALLAAMATIPVLNLLLPVIGTAVMMHVLYATDDANFAS